jgi:hypothetical protein
MVLCVLRDHNDSTLSNFPKLQKSKFYLTNISVSKFNFVEFNLGYIHECMQKLRKFNGIALIRTTAAYSDPKIPEYLYSLEVSPRAIKIQCFVPKFCVDVKIKVCPNLVKYVDYCPHKLKSSRRQSFGA